MVGTHPLARWRALRGWTQQELAEKAGVHPLTITRIEGGRDPSLQVALAIADALHVEVESIWGDPRLVEAVIGEAEIRMADAEELKRVRAEMDDLKARAAELKAEAISGESGRAKRAQRLLRETAETQR